ncbi:MAG: tetratricopeptide repeat protein, partial [Alphaproteobacteria bacterium]
LVVVSLAWALGGCAAVLPEAARTLEDLKRTIRDGPSQLDNDQRLADLGFAAITEGNLGLAETYLDAALAINPNNPYALLNLGVVYQHTGRMPAARKLYNKLTVLDPPDTAVTATRERQVGTRLVDIARSNLAQLDADAALAGLPAPSSEDAERAILTRFAALERLHDEELISAKEYAARRQANLGVLLPRTAQAPAPEIVRPAPHVEHIIVRLKAIRQFRDAGALTAREYALERASILDGLMPLQPNAPIRPTAKPGGEDGATPQTARLDRLLALKLITPQEYRRERAAPPTMTAAETPQSGQRPPETARGQAEPGPEAALRPAKAMARSGSASAPTVPVARGDLDRRSRIIADGPVPSAFPPTVPYDPLPPRAMTVTAAEPAPSAPASRSNPVNGAGSHAVNGGGPGSTFPPAVSYDPMPRPIIAVAAAQPAPAPTAPVARESNGHNGFSFAANGGATGSLAPPIDDYDPAPASATPTTANGSTPAPHVSRREPASGPPVSLREPVPATVAALRPTTEPMRTNGTAAARNGANPVAGGKQLGIHLSSFRTPERARRNWKDLRAEHGDLLDGLGARIARVDLGDDKGVFFELRAGPIADEDAALALCSELKRRSLYCAPTIF